MKIVPLKGTIKDLDADIQVVVAGNPTEHLEMLKAAGVDDFIHVKVNALETLKAYQRKFGINEL